MELVTDWRRVVATSLSFWMQVIGLLLMIVPEIWYAATGQDYNPAVAWWLGVLFLVAGLAGRLYQQKLSVVREWMRIAGIVLIVFLLALLLAGRVLAAPVSEKDTLAVAVPFIAQEEGERLVAYKDIVGVWTICSGSTRGVYPGMRRTVTECRDLLRAEVAEYRSKLHRYFTDTTKARRLTSKRDTAYVSLAYNAGVYAIGRSTATRRLNAGNIKGGCQALTWWNKAGGRVIRGLVSRRTREKAYCMDGL
ncbi:Phage-related lysozyme (muramidase), GH24 family [Cohaesibacter marisflavi]|uniref:Lysozyme n=1 Tax=Cohaesibacter marisflavi TaxID=655353 RepID=A0A1I5IDT4_9HYPH|nr:lysozyme [Cohaesibacter marisflavi]SFO58400.1 Phage-related lysozyme (muramidase), GH24 family [Cohaesibacter marisflavi]